MTLITLLTQTPPVSPKTTMAPGLIVLITAVVTILVVAAVAIGFFCWWRMKKLAKKKPVEIPKSFEEGLKALIGTFKEALPQAQPKIQPKPQEAPTNDGASNCDAASAKGDKPVEAEAPAEQVVDAVDKLAIDILGLYEKVVKAKEEERQADLKQNVDCLFKQLSATMTSTEEEQVPENQEDVSGAFGDLLPKIVTIYKKTITKKEEEAQKRFEEQTAAKEEEHKKAIEELEASHHQALADEASKHINVLKEKEEAYKQETDRLNKKHQEETLGLQKQLTDTKTQYENRIAEKEKTHNKKLQDKDAQHEAEIKDLNSKHAKEIAEEQQNTAEYRKVTEFAKEPRHGAVDYVMKTLDVFKLVRNTRIKAEELEAKGAFNNEDVNYFYKKSMNKFAQMVSDNAALQAWTGELEFFVKSGLYSTANDSILRSVFSGKTTAEEQLANLKSRLHHDVMATYGSSALILLQELSVIDKLSGISVDSSAMKLFADSLSTLKKMLEDMGYQLKMVALLTPFKGSDDVKAVGSVPEHIEAFAKEAILEVVKVGIRYGGSKEKTEVIINK